MMCWRRRFLAPVGIVSELHDRQLASQLLVHAHGRNAYRAPKHGPQFRSRRRAPLKLRYAHVTGRSVESGHSIDPGRNGHLEHEKK